MSFLCFFPSYLQLPQAGARVEENFQSRMGAIGMRTLDAPTAVPGQERASSSRSASTKGTLYYVAPCPLHDKYCCFSIRIAFLWDDR